MNPVRIKSIDISSSWADDDRGPCIGSLTVNVGAHPVRLTLNQDQIDRIVEAALTPAMETLREVGRAMTPEAIRAAADVMACEDKDTLDALLVSHRYRKGAARVTPIPDENGNATSGNPLSSRNEKERGQ